LEINDLREFRPPLPSPLALAGRGQEPKHLCHKGTHRTQKKNLLSLCPFVAFCGQFIPGFPRPLFPFPLQNVKEQAPERRSYSILPRFDGNAIEKIQALFGIAPFGEELTMDRTDDTDANRFV
jgi:hypothetical protein